MKAITTTMYVCGSLMVAATIMGAIDYSSVSRKGTLEKLYKEETPQLKAPAAPKEIDMEDYSRGEINRPVETIEVKTVKKAIAKKTVAKKKKKINYKDFSRKAIVERMPMVDTTVVKK